MLFLCISCVAAVTQVPAVPNFEISLSQETLPLDTADTANAPGELDSQGESQEALMDSDYDDSQTDESLSGTGTIMNPELGPDSEGRQAETSLCEEGSVFYSAEGPVHCNMSSFEQNFTAWTPSKFATSMTCWASAGAGSDSVTPLGSSSMPSTQERVVPEVNNPEAQHSSSAAAGPARAFHHRLMHNFNDPHEPDSTWFGNATMPAAATSKFRAEAPEFPEVSFWTN